MRIRDILPALLAFGIPVSINLLSILVFTRHLSLHDYGKLSLAWVSIEFTCGILYSWCKMGMMRFYDKSQRSIVISMQFCIIISLFLLFSLILLNVFGSEAGLHNKGILSLIIIGIIGKGLSYFIQDIQRILHKDLTKYTIVTFFINFAYYVPAILTILWFKQNTSIETILSLQTIGLLVFILIISAKPVWLFRKHLVKKQKSGAYQRFIKYGVPIGVSAIAAGMFTRIDRYIIEYVLGFKDLGIYSAAFNLSNLAISSVFSILTISTYPEIIRRLNSERLDEAKAIYKKNGSIILTIIPICIFLSCLFNSTLCTIFFGAKGNEIAFIFPFVLIATCFFNLKIHYFDQIFQFTKTTQTGMLLSLALGIGHLLLGYWMIDNAGLPGIALSSAIISVIGIIFTYLFSIKRFSIKFDSYTLILNGAASIILIIYLVNHYKV